MNPLIHEGSFEMGKGVGLRGILLFFFRSETNIVDVILKWV